MDGVGEGLALGAANLLEMDSNVKRKGGFYHIFFSEQNLFPADFRGAGSPCEVARETAMGDSTSQAGPCHLSVGPLTWSGELVSPDLGCIMTVEPFSAE